jgi:exonuclease III
MANGEDGSGYTAEVEDAPARLDYAFVSASLRDRIRSCWVDCHANGSDHQPLWMELV